MANPEHLEILKQGVDVWNTATDLAAEVRSYYIPDFTRWKDHDFYQKSFERLLRDLKAED